MAKIDGIKAKLKAEKEAKSKKEFSPDFIKAVGNSYYAKKPKKYHNGYYDYLESYQDNDTDRDIWDAMTSGEDYPDEGFDGDYESWGF